MSGPTGFTGVEEFGLGVGMWGAVSKKVLGLPTLKGASNSLNYFTYLAFKNTARGQFVKRTMAPLLIQINHNILSGKMFRVGWETLSSTTASTVWARSMQNSAMMSGLTMMGAGTYTFPVLATNKYNSWEVYMDTGIFLNPYYINLDK